MEARDARAARGPAAAHRKRLRVRYGRDAGARGSRRGVLRPGASANRQRRRPGSSRCPRVGRLVRRRWLVRGLVRPVGEGQSRALQRLAHRHLPRASRGDPRPAGHRFPAGRWPRLLVQCRADGAIPRPHRAVPASLGRPQASSEPARPLHLAARFTQHRRLPREEGDAPGGARSGLEDLRQAPHPGHPPVRHRGRGEPHLPGGRRGRPQLARNHDRRPGAEVLLLHPPGHPPAGRYQERDRVGRGPDQGQGREEQAFSALPGGRVRRHLRGGDLQGRLGPGPGGRAQRCRKIRHLVHL